MKLTAQYVFLLSLGVFITKGNGADIIDLKKSDPINISRLSDHFQAYGMDSEEEDNGEIGSEANLENENFFSRRETQYAMSPFGADDYAGSLAVSFHSSDWEEFNDDPLDSQDSFKRESQEWPPQSSSLEELKQTEKMKKIKKGMGVLLTESIPFSLSAGIGAINYYVWGALFSLTSTPLALVSTSISGLSYLGIRFNLMPRLTASLATPTYEAITSKDVHLLFTKDCDEKGD